MKKLFRQTSRTAINGEVQSGFQRLNALYRGRKLSSFLNTIRRRNHRKSSSKLHPSDFNEYYRDIMSDTSVLTEQQSVVITQVNDLLDSCDGLSLDTTISDSHISKLIGKLKRNCSPGHDGITAEHLIYGRSETLCHILAQFYSIIISSGIVPSEFNIGIIRNYTR